MKVRYDNHPEEWKKVLTDPVRNARSLTWLRTDRLDNWLHQRLRSPLTPLFKYGIKGKWLTIGDGRYGTDAAHLISAGIEDVHATDITDELLSIGASKGIIRSYSVQNAEALNFSDDAFDYAYCKESYHHFPRPYIAVYEMIRVSKEAVVLTEPIDAWISLAPLALLRRLLKRETHSFEAVGNYVYSVSEREIEKLLLGLGLRHCAFFGICTHYVNGVEETPLSGGTVRDHFMRFRVKGMIRLREFLSLLGVIRPTVLIAILFKKAPSQVLVKDLKERGFTIKTLPENPYL